MHSFCVCVCVRVCLLVCLRVASNPQPETKTTKNNHNYSFGVLVLCSFAFFVFWSFGLLVLVFRLLWVIGTAQENPVKPKPKDQKNNEPNKQKKTEHFQHSPWMFVLLVSSVISGVASLRSCWISPYQSPKP